MGHIAAGKTIIEAFKANGYPTAEECETLRLNALAEEATFEAEGREKVLGAIDELIAFLQTNREHIAGVAVVVIPFHNDKVVEADRTATDGRSALFGVSSEYKTLLYDQLRDRVARANNTNPFAQLFG